AARRAGQPRLRWGRGRARAPASPRSRSPPGSGRSWPNLAPRATPRWSRRRRCAGFAAASADARPAASAVAALDQVPPPTGRALRRPACDVVDVLVELREIAWDPAIL